MPRYRGSDTAPYGVQYRFRDRLHASRGRSAPACELRRLKPYYFFHGARHRAKRRYQVIVLKRRMEEELRMCGMGLFVSFLKRSFKFATIKICRGILVRKAGDITQGRY